MRFLFILLCLGIGVQSYAQHHILRHYTVENGLCSSEIYDMHQDSLGRMWFATSSGLCMYDGLNFRSYSYKDGLSENDVLKIFPDSKGWIWVTTYGGMINMFDGQVIHSPQTDDLFKKIPMLRVHRYFYEDTLSGSRFFGTNQLLEINPVKDYVRTTPLAHKKGYCLLLEPLENGEFHAWQNLTKIKINNDPDRSTEVILNFEESLKQILKTKKGNYIRVWGEKIDIIQGTDTSEIPFKQLWGQNLYVLSMKQLRDGRIVFCTTNGAWIYRDLQLKEYTHYGEGYEVSSIVLDRDSVLWFGTLNNGVLAGRDASVISFTSQEGLSEIFSLYRSRDGSIWAGGNASEVYRLYNQKLTTSKLKTKFNLADRRMRILAFFEDSQNQLYAGGDGGLFRLTGKKPRVFTIPAIKTLGPETQQGDLLISSPGLWPFNEHRAKNLDLSKLFIVDNFITSTKVSRICVDSLGRIWAAAVLGVYRWNSESEMLNKAIPPDTLIKGSFNDLETDSEGNVWATSDGRGLWIFKEDSVLNIDTDNGLSSDLCTSLSLGKDGAAWVGSKFGLNRVKLNPDGTVQKIRRYGTLEGLSANEINDVIAWEDTIWVATAQGLTRFIDAGLLRTFKPPLIWMTELKVNGEVWPLVDSLRLPHYQNRLDLRFQIASPNNLKPPQYFYKLEGQNPDWIEVSGAGLSFNSLPSGTYRLLIRAKTDQDLWSKNILTLFIEIGTPWWKSAWALPLGGLLLLLIGLTIGFFYNRNQKRKQNLQMRALLAEQKALRAQMNPHFLFNALNAIQKFFIKHQAIEGNRYLNKFSAMIRRILENSDRMYVSIQEEMGVIKPYLEFERLRSGESFNFEISIEEGIKADYEQIPSMLIQPLLENAIWHGLRYLEEAGKLRLSIFRMEKTLVMEVEDNGVGRLAAEEFKSGINRTHKSMGLKLIQERIGTINRLKSCKLSLQIEDKLDVHGKPAGTIARLKMDL